LSQKTKTTKPSAENAPQVKIAGKALANAIQELGALIETCADPSDLRQASRVLRSLAYIATVQASARRYRVAGSVDRATQQEHILERLYTELPAEVKW
jgi:hypothetical protein